MADLKKWDHLQDIIYKGDPDLTVYVYRVDSRGKRQKPYLLRTYPDHGLLETLRDDHGAGEFDIMIRDGNIMVLSGRFGFELPLNRSKHRKS
jgi:hypothetical protein